MSRKHLPIFEIYWRPIIEYEFRILEYGFPVSNTPLIVGTAVALPHIKNKRAGVKKKGVERSQQSDQDKSQGLAEERSPGRGERAEAKDKEK